MSLLSEIEHAESTPVDFRFIKAVASPIVPKMHMIRHDSLPEKPDLHKDIMKGDDAVVILFRVHHNSRPTPMAHWCTLFKGKHGFVFFDSLAINLRRIYALTGEKPKLLHALRNTKYEKSHHALQQMISKQKYCGTACAVRLRYSKRLTNRGFERMILQYDASTPGKTLALMCLFHFIDEDEYDKKYLKKFIE
jgi:hypothetical protein